MRCRLWLLTRRVPSYRYRACPQREDKAKQAQFRGCNSSWRCVRYTRNRRAKSLSSGQTGYCSMEAPSVEHTSQMSRASHGDLMLFSCSMASSAGYFALVDSSPVIK
ncbi:hypothetical protein LX36DRAFT_279734 [Colletotrichum falcatum]|nr:hypothetical protein LX36DRAFT_279734 [Colletotrichum falcatum]